MMKRQKYKGYTVLDEVQHYEFCDYENVKDKIIDIYSHMPYLISVYQLGSVTHPGISDLDFAFVIDDNAQKYDYRKIYRELDTSDRYILKHSPFITPLFFFKNLRYFYIPGNMRLVFGNETEVCNIPKQSFIEKIIVLEYVLGIFFSILRMIDVKVLKVRSLLCTLNSLKYDIVACGMNNRKFPELQNYIERISKLRTNWFNLLDADRISSLIEVLQLTPTVICNIIDHLAGLLSKHESRTYNNKRVHVSPNGYVQGSINDLCNYNVNNRYLLNRMLQIISFSNQFYDLSWIFSDYIVIVPPNLIPFILGKECDGMNELLQRRYQYLSKYQMKIKHYKGFGSLLPSLTMPFQINNIKWLALMVIRNILLQNIQVRQRTV